MPNIDWSTGDEITSTKLDAMSDGVWSVEQFGAVGDGLTNDSPAIQLALNACRDAGRGVVAFKPGHVYLMSSTVIVYSNTTILGAGAVVKSLQGSSGVTFVNQSAANAKGYGAGGKNIHFVGLTWLGDYATTPSDIGTGWNHVENLSFTNCKFEQGMVNGHYIDLGGCRNVRVVGCTFLGMNPVANRSYVEAVQIDVNTLQGSSWKSEPASAFDGLPTRDVIIDGCYFAGLTVGSTTYPAPNPVGSHTVALDSDSGYFENIKFVNNIIRGTYIPATQAVSGWCHFYGARGVEVSGNTFYWTGSAGVTGNPQVISFTQAVSGVPLSDVALSSPGSVTFAAPRSCMNVTVVNNKFIGFSTAPTQSGTGLITALLTSSIVIQGNVCDGASTSFHLGSGGTQIVQSNIVTVSTTEPAISLNTCDDSHVKDNRIALPTNGVGIKMFSGSTPQVSGNVVRGGATHILIDAGNNTLVQGNTCINFTSVGISVSPTTASTDVVVSGNRAGSNSGSSTCLLIGASSTRCRRWGNLWRGPGLVTDNGTGTTTVATDQTT